MSDNLGIIATTVAAAIGAMGGLALRYKEEFYKISIPLCASALAIWIVSAGVVLYYKFNYGYYQLDAVYCVFGVLAFCFFTALFHKYF